jgi:hypothetical protein
MRPSLSAQSQLNINTFLKGLCHQMNMAFVYMYGHWTDLWCRCRFLIAHANFPISLLNAVNTFLPVNEKYSKVGLMMLAAYTFSLLLIGH